MTKQEALKVLIEHSSLLTPTVKEKLIEHIPHMSPEDIDALGGLFSAEKEQFLETVGDDLDTLSTLLEKLKEMK
jgi:hypothetical protein